VSSDRLSSWREALAGLDDRPVAEHPDVLERLHRELVADLDGLAGLVQAPAEER
jgi:hypothetical protein